MLKGERVTIPEFELVSCPTIHLKDIRERRFSILDMYSRIADVPRDFLVANNITQEEAEEYFAGAEDFEW